MAQVLLVIGVIVVAWFAVAAVVALVLGRAVHLADDRQRTAMAYRSASRPAPVRRVPVRAS